MESTVAQSNDSPVAPGASGGSDVSYVLSPADGVHWFFYRGALVVVARGKESGGGTGSNFAVREEITVRVFALRSRAFVARVIEEARSSIAPNKEVTRVYTNQQWGWSTPIEVARRPLASVVLRAGVSEMLVSDARTFLGSKQWYRDRAIPWRRGYLLHGAPGCGKSSIAHALASELEMNVAVLSLQSTPGDMSLREVMQSLPRRSLLLIEDIDAAFAKREAKEAEYVSFSGLLNAIDGIAAAEGRILVMTTNHLDRIDAALRRAGRADFEVHIEAADENQAARMFARFFPERVDLAAEFGRANVGRSPADIQGLLVAHRADANAACAAMVRAEVEAA